jgi:RNA recognition motif-containing protein
MGKGFGYVNFASVDSVETAIQRNATELLGREIRVGRSVRKPKATINLAEKVKKGKLEKGVKKPVLVNKKVIKIGQKKLREAEEMSFQGQTADGSASGGDLKAKKIKKKKNRGEIKKKKIAEKFAKV